MKTLNFAVSLMILACAAWAEENKPIQKFYEEAGESRTYEIGSQTRKRSLFPSNSGQVGLFRLRSAESLPVGALTFGVGGEFYSVGSGPILSTGGAAANTIAESLFAGYSPWEDWTFAIQRRNSSTTYRTGVAADQLISSLGDFSFSVLRSFRLSPSFALAGFGELQVASNFNALTPSGNTVSGVLGIAGTYSLFPGSGIPLLWHTNVAYRSTQIRGVTAPGIQPETFFNFYRYDTLLLGTGLEYDFENWFPFLEFEHILPFGGGTGPFRATFGVRFTPFENKGLAFLLGTDVALHQPSQPGVPYYAPVQAIGQVSYTFGVSQSERRHYAVSSDVNIVDRKFILKKTVKFKNASAELESESTVLLDEIARVIISNQVRRLLIVGHTDSSHTEDYNLKLSIDRANSVKRYLVSKGVEAELLTQGYGKRKPVASNNTDEGRTTNRRVEFFILD